MSSSITANFHTHTALCHHAEGQVADYCQSALEAGLSVLGISDHTPLRAPKDPRWQNVRMQWSEFPSYLSAIAAARNRFQNLQLLAGLECDYHPDYHAFYQDELLGEYKLDYLIAGVHYYQRDGHWCFSHDQGGDARDLRAYVNDAIAAMESGLFAFLAHPDLFGILYESWDQNAIAASHDILACAAACRLPLELNALGFRKPKMHTRAGLRYPFPLYGFWELASEYDLDVVINSDAHSPADIVGEFASCQAIAARYNLRVINNALFCA